MNRSAAVRLASVVGVALLAAGVALSVIWGSVTGALLQYKCSALGESKYILLNLSMYSSFEAYDECGILLSQPAPLYYGSGSGGLFPADVSSAGTEILVHNWSYIRAGRPPKAEIWTLDGNRLKSWISRMPLRNASVSPDQAFVAAAGSVGPTKQGADEGIRGLFVDSTDGYDAANGFKGWRLFVPIDLDRTASSFGQQVSWNSASDRIVTTIGGKVAIVEIPGGRTEFIADGQSPKWSPDGRQIAYQSPAEELVIRDMSTGAERKPLPGMRVEGSCLEWSPDMRLLSLCEVPEKQPDPQNRVLVFVGILQLRDGKYLRANRWTWGRQHDYRWLATPTGDLEPLIKLAERIHKGPGG